MASAYFEALAELGISPDVVGNSELGCKRFEERHQVEVFRKGLSEYLSLKRPSSAVLCASIVASPALCQELVKAQVPLVLAEKPLVLSTDDYDRLNSQLHSSATKLYIALNRRFLDSVGAVRRALGSTEEEFHMSITFGERVSNIANLPHPQQVLSRWVVANSIHVFDAAFFIAGEPALNFSEQAGSLSWHPSGAIFRGEGSINSQKIPTFDYFADWREEGSWKIEFSSSSSRFVLEPLETATLYAKSERVGEVSERSNSTLKPGLVEMYRDFVGPRAYVQDFSTYRTRLNILEQVGGYAT